MSLDKFFNQSLSRWMDGTGSENTVVISSRMRLARNLGDYPFPGRAEPKQLDEVVQQVRRWWNIGGLEALGSVNFMAIKELSPSERQALVDKHLVSPALARHQQGAVLTNQEESVSIMINEEDHLRIQALLPGLQLDEAWRMASLVDDQFDGSFRYAWSPQQGFLTSCPTNVGTGMRASVMLHLPGLSLTGQLGNILATVTKLGIVVRGLFGEGSEAQGNLYQISNQITLGQSEDEIIEALNRLTLQIIGEELKARELLKQRDPDGLSDRVWRAYGILAHSRRISSREAMELISALRLGLDLKLIKGIPPRILNELIVFIRPGYLQKVFDRELQAEVRDSYRAQLIRERIKISESGGDTNV
jgi:protein arginine kinase